MSQGYRALAGLILTLLCSSKALGQNPRCDLQTAALISKDQNWGDLYSSFKHAPCDDGAVAQAFSQNVVHSLTTHWAELPALQQLASADSTFMVFVLKHVDSTAEKKALEAVAHNASDRCPKALPSLCAAIAEAAEHALHQ